MQTAPATDARCAEQQRWQKKAESKTGCIPSARVLVRGGLAAHGCRRAIVAVFGLYGVHWRCLRGTHLAFLLQIVADDRGRGAERSKRDQRAWAIVVFRELERLLQNS